MKLTRALWITPVVLGYAFFKKEKQKIKFPLFIIGFLLAALVRSLVPTLQSVWDDFAFGARRLLVVTLFLIGTGLTREVLKKVGIRPLIQGISLWVIVSSVTLAKIVSGLVRTGGR